MFTITLSENEIITVMDCVKLSLNIVKLSEGQTKSENYLELEELIRKFECADETIDM